MQGEEVTYSLFVSLDYCAKSTVRWFVVKEKRCWMAADSAEGDNRWWWCCPNRPQLATVPHLATTPTAISRRRVVMAVVPLQAVLLPPPAAQIFSHHRPVNCSSWENTTKKRKEQISLQKYRGGEPSVPLVVLDELDDNVLVWLDLRSATA
jgi:hypothetical protein